MAVPFSNTKLRVPRGFQNLLEGFAREVLRSQPSELYTFGAEYFENLQKQRDESGIDPAEHGAKVEDRFYNNKAFTEPSVDPSNPQQQDAALAIQTKYRQHAAKQEVENIREDKAATKIQAGFRGHQDREKVKQIRSGSGEAAGDGEVDTAVPIEEEIDIDLADPEIEAAAVKIQAGFKGFKARQEVQRIKSGEASKSTVQVNETSTEPEPINPDEEVDIDLNDPEVEQAAIKIQAGFKGLKARRDFSAKQKAADEAETEESGEAVTTADENAAGVVPAAEPEKASETTTEPEKPASDQTEVLTAETAETLTEASANPAAPAEPNVPAEAAVTDSAVTDAAATDAAATDADATGAVATEPAAAESAVAESAAAETAVSEPTAVEPSAAMPAATEPAAAEPAASELAADEVVAEAASEQLVPAAVSNTTDTAAEPEAPVAEAVDANKPVEAATADGGSGEVPAEQVAEPAQPAES